MLATCLFSNGCKKELNVLPTTSQVDGNIIVDSKSAATALNGVYYRFANSGTDFFGRPSTAWVDVNEVLPSQLSGLCDYTGGGSDITAFTFDARSGVSDLTWSYAYSLVNAANGFLKNLDPVTSLSDAAKKQLQGEGRFLRAFGNSELLLYFAQYHDMNSDYGILLRNEFVNADNIVLPRATVAESYTSILADLDFAIENLPNLNTQIFYANKWAAKLLKARILINRGTATDYQEVIALTKDIISNSPFVLEGNVKDLFLTKAFTSTEVMLGIQPYPNASYKFPTYQTYSFYAGTLLMENIFENDPRNQWVYKQYEDPYYGYGMVDALTKFYTGDPSPDNAVQSPNTEYSYAFRLTEAYLLQAEALTLSNGDLSSAKSLLKTILSHAGVTYFSVVDQAGSAAALQELIVKEEMRSFVTENGADWFALRRLPFASIQRIRPEIKSADQLILPIPYNEIIANNKIIQNPGY